MASLTVAGGLKQKCALEMGVNYLIILSVDPFILKVPASETDLAAIGFIR